eukprot:CAMPEP_0185028252 /NCGR_PEP_ID=MMETSP1103-20130426/13922_1 /TAXON_ID=36769 /ORGANISM="Paraphysomonas bandaiensis, Strain Caron Lab Isolate" /LENGTH=455 /DNA_ID=CAMNT_0027562627 /DNA_START=62 /DNA_END=1429 /DNA_ORIENTATION=+
MDHRYQGPSPYPFTAADLSLCDISASRLTDHITDTLKLLPSYNSARHDSEVISSRFKPKEDRMYEVECKRSRYLCKKSATCTEDFVVGDYVRLEGDHGNEIVGIVCDMTVHSIESLLHYDANERESLLILAGRATVAEIKNMSTKIRDEDRALKICSELTSRRQLQIRVVDATFQNHRNKLTFSYLASSRVDFRELVRDLFSIFKTRIWMQKLDINGNEIHSSLPSCDSHTHLATYDTLHHTRHRYPIPVVSDIDKVMPVSSRRSRQLHSSTEAYLPQYHEYQSQQIPPHHCPATKYMDGLISNSSCGTSRCDVSTGAAEGESDSLFKFHRSSAPVRKLQMHSAHMNHTECEHGSQKLLCRTKPSQYTGEVTRVMPSHSSYSPPSSGSHLSPSVSGSGSTSSSCIFSPTHSPSPELQALSSLKSGNNGKSGRYFSAVNSPQLFGYPFHSPPEEYI